jgi:PHD/YefM family antitoxin component YafN of YafNO toxin-antitoxin module
VVFFKKNAKGMNTSLKQQFIKDEQGNKIAVILPIQDYEKMMEEIEELEDIKLYDEAKKEDNGSRISLEEYSYKRTNK